MFVHLFSSTNESSSSRGGRSFCTWTGLSTMACVLPRLHSGATRGMRLRSFRSRREHEIYFLHISGPDSSLVMSLDPKVIQKLGDLRQAIEEIPVRSKVGQHQKATALILVDSLESDIERITMVSESEKRMLEHAMKVREEAVKVREEAVKVSEEAFKVSEEAVKDTVKMREEAVKVREEAVKREQELLGSLLESERNRLESERSLYELQMQKFQKEIIVLRSKNKFRGAVEYLLDKVVDMHEMNGSLKCKHKFTAQEAKSKKVVLAHLLQCEWFKEHIKTGYSDGISIRVRPANQVLESIGPGMWNTICSMHHPPFDEEANVQIPVGGTFTDNNALFFFSLCGFCSVSAVIVSVGFEMSPSSLQGDL